MNILVINGPNLNRLGHRNPDIYGRLSLEDVNSMLATHNPDTDFEFFQSNHEGEIIDRIQQAYTSDLIDGIIINPGAFAHYSYAIADAIEDCPLPTVEVHISNIFAREQFRALSVTGARARAVISGAGAYGYQLAVLSLKTLS